MKVAAVLLTFGLAPAFFWITGSPGTAARVGGGEVALDSGLTAEAAEGVPSTRIPEATKSQAVDRPVYLVYYWRARPGREAEYSAYVRDYAEPIDEEARKAGVFEEVHTYTPFLRTGAEGADWTHMRVFKLKNFAALDGFSAGLDAATDRVYPDRSQRPSSAGMRDLVRQEIWRDF
jgi:hypothetical protein